MAKVVLSYGMGVDSTVILTRWLLEPRTRDFDLRDLIVLTAQVGNEFPDTKALVERHMLPLMREHRIRYVQIARKTKSTKDGIVVLSDTTSPKTCHTEGSGWSLYDEMVTAGTVPQKVGGSRTCTHHFKGWPLDVWIANEMGERNFRHVIGFNADEDKRVKRDKSYATDVRHPEYPLVEWRMGRQACEDYLEEAFGEPWKKSCCFFCPYADNAQGLDAHMERMGRYPELAAKAALMERLSASLNPRQLLFTRKRNKVPVSFEERLDECESCGRAREARDAMLKKAPWGLYHVVRNWVKGKKRAVAQRQIEMDGPSTRKKCLDALEIVADELGLSVERDERYARVTVSPKVAPPCVEETYAVAPALAAEKVGRKRYAVTEEAEHEVESSELAP